MARNFSNEQIQSMHSNKKGKNLHDNCLNNLLDNFFNNHNQTPSNITDRKTIQTPEIIMTIISFQAHNQTNFIQSFLFIYDLLNKQAKRTIYYSIEFWP